jgi:hypothetical protein
MARIHVYSVQCVKHIQIVGYCIYVSNTFQISLFKIRPVCPTYADWHVERVRLYMPLFS